MVLDTWVSECIEWEINQEQEWMLSEKQVFLNNMLHSGIEITTESEFKKVSEVLLIENIYDLSNVSFNDISKSWQAFALKKINPSEDILTIFSLYSAFNLNENWPFSKWGTITNWGVFELELSRDINYLKSNNNQFQILMNQYNNAQWEVVEDSKDQLCSLENDVEVVTGRDEGIVNIWYNNDWNENHILSENNVIEQVDEIESNLEQDVEDIIEPELKKEYEVVKDDTIWDILQEQFDFTEKQANVAIKKLENNPEFLSQLKSRDIDTIYQGEMITFSKELLSSLKTQESIVETNEGTWSYKVEKWDTPSHILMKYKWVNWGNINSIAQELNMSVVKLWETITLAKTITLKNGTTITKTDS